MLQSNSTNRSVAAAMFRDSAMTRADLDLTFTSYDLKRLELYSRNMVDYHLITDLLPTLTKLYFLNRLDVNFSAVQAVNSHANVLYFYGSFAKDALGLRVTNLGHFVCSIHSDNLAALTMRPNCLKLN